MHSNNSQAVFSMMGKFLPRVTACLALVISGGCSDSRAATLDALGCQIDVAEGYDLTPGEEGNIHSMHPGGHVGAHPVIQYYPADSFEDHVIKNHIGHEIVSEERIGHLRFLKTKLFSNPGWTAWDVITSDNAFFAAGPAGGEAFVEQFKDCAKRSPVNHCPEPGYIESDALEILEVNIYESRDVSLVKVYVRMPEQIDGAALDYLWLTIPGENGGSQFETLLEPLNVDDHLQAYVTADKSRIGDYKVTAAYFGDSDQRCPTISELAFDNHPAIEEQLQCVEELGHVQCLFPPEHRGVISDEAFLETLARTQEAHRESTASRKVNAPE